MSYVEWVSSSTEKDAKQLFLRIIIIRIRTLAY
jgi:hypothetical protein